MMNQEDRKSGQGTGLEKEQAGNSGAELFLRPLGGAGGDFQISLRSRDAQELMRAEARIVASGRAGGDAVLAGSASSGAKIVGLVPARNESARIGFCLKALARFTDAIVYLDDCSDDDTVAVVESMAKECRVERILRKEKWHRDEPGDRNALLQAGREIGGTHFIVIDADEAFTANLAENNLLRNFLLWLLPGDQLVLNWIQLWRGVEHYRFDDSVWTWNYKGFAFRDDGRCSYNSGFIHTPRIPDNLSGRRRILPGYAFGLLHFQFANWRNLLVKQAWYRCLERIRDPRKPVAEINKLYAPSKDETGLRVAPSPDEWLRGYEFFAPDIARAADAWREPQVLGWFQEHGGDYFKDLDIWDVDWGAELSSAAAAFTPGPEQLADANESQQLAEGLLREAAAALQRNDLPRAIDRLARAQDRAPLSAEVMIALGNLCLLSGDAAAARWEFVKAGLLHPGNADAWVQLATAAVQMERFVEFENAIARALEINPDHAGAMRLVGNLNIRQQNWAEAARCFYKVIRQSPEDVEALLSLGACFARTGDIESARLNFERVLEIDPGNAEARKQLQNSEGCAQRGASTPAAGVIESVEDFAREDAAVWSGPLVTAIVSTFNSERFLGGCLEDLEAQTIADKLEIIVVDSGSEQNERTIVEEFRRRHCNIVYIRTEREPLYAAWNRAVKIARGKFLTSANTDDRHHPRAFERMAGALEERKAGLVYADSWRRGARTKRSRRIGLTRFCAGRNSVSASCFNSASSARSRCGAGRFTIPWDISGRN